MNDVKLERLEARVAALDSPIPGDVDLDAMGAALGLTAAEVAEAKAWTHALPPGTSGWDAARMLGEELNLHPADIMAEAREIMAIVETMP
jgi:hypothetical protein